MLRVHDRSCLLQDKNEDKDTPLSGGVDFLNRPGCRCREVSMLTPRGLFRLMMRDMVFWKGPGEEISLSLAF